MSNVLIRIPNWLGDAVMATAAIRHYCRCHPDQQVSLLGVPQTLPVYEHNPHVHHLIEFDRKVRHAGLSGMCRLGLSLRQQKFEKCFLLTNSFSSALLFSIADIPERIGFTSPLRNWMLTQRIYLHPNGRHQVERYAYLLHEEIPSDLKTEIVLTDDELAQADELLAAESLTDRPLVALGIGAAYGPSKRWHPRRFGQLAKKLSDEMNVGVLLLGSKTEQEIAQEACAEARGDVVNLVGKTSLRLLFALLKRCDLVVCNDSGTMHCATALGTPVVALFGPTRARETSPYGTNAQVLQKNLPCSPCFERTCPLTHHECMEMITVDEVYQAVRSGL